MSYDFVKNKNNLRCSVEKLKTKTKFVFLLFDFLPKKISYTLFIYLFQQIMLGSCAKHLGKNYL